MVDKGRFTTTNDRDITVFLIGMRIHKWWLPHKWFPVFLAMPPMLKELFVNKESIGFLSGENYFGLRTTVSIQYWQSPEQLMAYAKNDKHLSAWQNFQKKVGQSDAVGIYHETYTVKAGDYESVFSNMNPYGLSKALKKRKIDGRSATAKNRLRTKVE